MRFALSDDQQAFSGAVAELLSDQATPERLRKAAAEPGERTGAVWSRLSDLGLFNALLPETSGGLGLGGVDAVLIAEQLGRFAVPGPVAETALHVPLVLTRWGSATAAEEWMTRYSDGGVVATARIDPGGFMPDADIADLVLLDDGASVRAAPTDQLRLVEQPQVDPTRRFFTLDGDVTGFPAVAVNGTAADALRDVGAVLTAAQLLGAGTAVLDQAVEYAQQRSQFGRLIGSYQALKHHLANVRIALDFARPLILRAGYGIDADGPTRSRDCSAAKAAAATAADLAARTALQVHGAIGYTEELDLQLWLKRIWSLLPQWGTATDHRGAVLAALGHDSRPPRYP
jgi:hypothetical protein